MTTALDGWYVLTDGESQLSMPRFFAYQEEIDRAQEEANYKSGGDLWWIPKDQQMNRHSLPSPEAVQQST